MLEELTPIFAKYQLGDTIRKEDIIDLLRNEKIFGVDLEKYGLADKVVSYLNEELSEAGAVRNTLEKYL
jgi:fructuronate reductase